MIINHQPKYRINMEKNKNRIPEAFEKLSDHPDELTHNSILYNSKFDLIIYVVQVDAPFSDGTQIIHGVPDGDENPISFTIDLRYFYIYIP